MTSATNNEVDEKEPEYVEVSADRSLLNPNFDKYVISTQDLPVFKFKLPVPCKFHRNKRFIAESNFLQ